MSPVWETAADWDSAQSEDGVVHESTADTDHNDATIVKQGYPVASPLPASASLVAYYPGHEDLGSVLTDKSGAGIYGDMSAVGGPTPNQGGLLSSTAWSYDGVDDGHTAGDVDYFAANGTSVSISAWVYLATSGNGQQIIGKTGSNGNDNWRVGIDGSDRPEFRIDAGGGNTDLVGTAIATNTWVHVAGVYDAGTGDQYLYQNGSQAATGTSNTGGVDTNNNSVKVANNDYTGFHEGRVCEVRLYDTALSASQVQTIYDVVATAGSLTAAAKTA